MAICYLLKAHLGVPCPHVLSMKDSIFHTGVITPGPEQNLWLPSRIVQFRRQQTGSQTGRRKPQVLVLGELSLVKWNSHFYFSSFKEWHLIAQLKGQFLKLMGEPWSRPREEKDFLEGPCNTLPILRSQGNLLERRVFGSGDAVMSPTRKRLFMGLSISPLAGICLEAPGHRSWTGSHQEVMEQGCLQDPTLNNYK